jgi:hypothetical protein
LGRITPGPGSAISQHQQCPWSVSKKFHSCAIEGDCPKAPAGVQVTTQPNCELLRKIPADETEKWAKVIYKAGIKPD